jgi:hypothetical protein
VPGIIRDSIDLGFRWPTQDPSAHVADPSVTAPAGLFLRPDIAFDIDNGDAGRPCRGRRVVKARACR